MTSILGPLSVKLLTSQVKSLCHVDRGKFDQQTFTDYAPMWYPLGGMDMGST